MIKIGVLTSDPAGAVSFYRVTGPLNALAKEHDNIMVVPLDKVCWSTFSTLDALFMHRCVTKTDIDVMNMAKIGGIPIWVDYDDNFMVIPKDNPAYDQYSKIEDLEENMREVLKLADVVTCTTAAMRDALFRIYERDITILPNAFNEKFVKREVRPRNKVILWRGSRTHLNDLVVGIDMVRKIYSDYPDHEWVFVGQDPWMYGHVLPQDKVFHVEGMETYKYHQFIQGLAPEFMFVPLADNEFNRAKSNIAWMEGTWAGAKVYASDLPEFHVPGCGLPELGIEPDAEASWSYIQQNLLLSKVNEKRLEIIHRLCGKV